MAAPSNNISLRITDDEIALLDARVGIDGARSRSDVIRMAIQQFLQLFHLRLIIRLFKMV